MAATKDTAGIYITQIGVSVQSAADYQFVFNSSWPSLAIAFDTVVNLAINQNITIPHNLEFIPFTEGMLLDINGNSLGRIFAISENFLDYQSSVGLSFDKINVYLVGSSTTAYQVNIKCYNLDITKQTNYTLPQFPTFKQPYDPSTGIKVSKFNKGITSTDLRDFILHSRAQSPAVLAVVTQASPSLPGATTGTVAFLNPTSKAQVSNHSVTYIPWTFAFYSSDGITYFPLAPGNQQSGANFQLTQNINGFDGITVSGSGAVLANTNPGAFGTLVVLRDPLITPTNIEHLYIG